MKHGANLTSPHVISKYVFASTFSDEVIHDEEVSQIVHVPTILFDLNASSFNQEANIKEPYFSVYILKLKILIHLLMMLIMKKK